MKKNPLTISAFVWPDTFLSLSDQTRRTEAAWEADSVLKRRTGSLVSEGGAGGLTLMMETVGMHETTGTLGSWAAR